MKNKFKTMYMNMAQQCANMSYCERLKVGCIILVEPYNIIVMGYNGTPAGDENICEIVCKDTGNLITKSSVIHAEQNAVNKFKSNKIFLLDDIKNNITDIHCFCTHLPCLDCLKSLISIGITKIYYKTEYRCKASIDYINKYYNNKIIIEKI